MSKCDINKVDQQQQQQQDKGAGAGVEGAGTRGAEGEVEGIAVAGATFTGYVISNFCPLLLLMESCKLSLSMNFLCATFSIMLQVGLCIDSIQLDST